MRFVYGPLSSASSFDEWLSSRLPDQKPSGRHWLDDSSGWLTEVRPGEGLIEYCRRFDKVTLWADPDPNSLATRLSRASRRKLA
jgi:hypothetical protein